MCLLEKKVQITPKIFTVEARLGENVIGTGSGHSKKSAEQHAAFEAIKRHKNNTKQRWTCI